MLELVKRVRTDDGDNKQLAYWVHCLKANTGDARISLLLQFPEQYAEDGASLRQRSDEEILTMALAAGKRRLASRLPCAGGVARRA